MSFYRSSFFQEFFESINPKSDFNNDGDALETYLYEKSLKVQPKEADRVPDIKPKRSLHVLKSPGIKPPKSNHYSTSHHHAATSYSTQSSTAPSTPRADGEGSLEIIETLFFSSDWEDFPNFLKQSENFVI
ncbi:unnamed protein product [Nippostrongylus brasiliensis]|uniref:Uncharacterized protein n=1 Tax=Nippostrongylus brasiliensis TaxID=27835 RepID=A0A3P7A0L3_NIPBR|nr:unnamed protein product [Nippostrongylus brasiliensis]